LLGYRYYMFNGQFRLYENLMHEKKFAKLILPRVYNGQSTTIFCVTRRLLDTTTRTSKREQVAIINRPGGR